MTRTISRRAFLRTAAVSTGATLAACLGAFGYANTIEPDWLELTRPELRLPRLDAAFDGYRIAHLTDIHFDNMGMDRARLAEIVALINAERPDLIAITGDFVTQHPARYEDWLRDGLAGLRAADGVMAVAGNHDYWYDGGIWMPNIVTAAGARWLSDSF
ncbi:MAG TPA: metallophosphoesterase, partial [Herpetosiphonaceae bacterium]